MSDTARDILDFQPASTEGLEEIYECTENHVESLDSRLVLTASEASAYLRMPLSTIYRRIKSAKFETRLGDDGVLRIILPVENAGDNRAVLTDPAGENQNEPPILGSSHDENQNEPTILADSPRDNQTTSAVSNAEFQTLLAIIADKDSRLEAATYRVGYLEAQLEGRDREIKLLTDSQHKPTWWQQFKAFFIKG